jgi:hypothetical protein
MKDLDHNWHRKGFKYYMRYSIFEGADENEFKLDAESEKALTEIATEAVEHSVENAKQLDGHLVYVTGGALFIVSQIFVADIFQDIVWMPAFIIAFSGFGISLMSVALSFIFNLESLGRKKAISDFSKKLLRNVQKLGKVVHDNDPDQFTKFIFDKDKSIENENVRTVYEETKEDWDVISRFAYISDLCLDLSKYSNWSAYIFFMIGMFSFLTFGVANMVGIHRQIENFDQHERHFERPARMHHY